MSLEAVDARSTIIGSKSEATVNIEDDDKGIWEHFLIAIKIRFLSSWILVDFRLYLNY